MTEHDQAPKRSPLTQFVERAGTTVSVEIYEDGDGGWLLEVVDEYGNSTVWDEPFTTDRDALDEALRTIEEGGIDSLVGSPSDIQPMGDLGQPLSKAEFDELDDFLADEGIQSTSMDVATLDEFLTAVNRQSLDQPPRRAHPQYGVGYESVRQPRSLVRQTPLCAPCQLHELFYSHLLQRMDEPLQFRRQSANFALQFGEQFVLNHVPPLHDQVASSSIYLAGFMMLAW